MPASIITSTTLLSPLAAVNLAWAMTGSFADDEESKQNSSRAQVTMNEIKENAEKEPSGKEAEYIRYAIAAIEANLRSIETVYKGRQLNFDENEKLRSTYLESVRESLEFGRKAKDFLKSLPMMTIGAAGGVTLADVLNLPDVAFWALGLALTGAGYFLNLLIVHRTRRYKQKQYIIQDYERNLYYIQYVDRISVLLNSLYEETDRAHKKVFGQEYPVEPEKTQEELIENLLSGIRPTYCPFVHKHMKKKLITSDLWAKCESGNPLATTLCPYWNK